MVNLASDNSIAIRSIQHYLYCPHRWGLMYIGDVWAENYFVTKANLLHARVHDPDKHYVRKNVKVFTGIEVYNDKPEFDIHGVVDCLELRKDGHGVPVSGEDGSFGFTIVEYKPTHPSGREYNADDMMQVFAQKLCTDYVFGCDSQGVIYYADTRQRIELPLSENYDEYAEVLKDVLKEMRNHLKAGTIPDIPRGQHCRGCSLKDLCMPGKRSRNKVRDMILESAHA